MKTFIMIVGSILTIASLAIFWLYSSLKFQPDYFDKVEKVDLHKMQMEGRQAETKIQRELQKNGEVKVDGEELTALFISQVSKINKINFKPILKKVKSEIVDGQLKIEALVNAKELSKQQMPKKVKEYIDIFLENAPENMLENIYVSFNGRPINDGSNLKFDDNSEIKIGDFSYNLSSIKGNNEIRISNDLLKMFGITNFEMLEQQILLKK